MADPRQAAPTNHEIAAAAAKLWPHREHEANSLLAQCCRFGIHRWRRLDLETLFPRTDICHCFWCSKIRIDGIVHDP